MNINQSLRKSFPSLIPAVTLAAMLAFGGRAITAAPAAAEPTSFQQTAAHLDAGGNFYLYLGTEQWLAGLSEKISGFRQLVLNLPDIDETGRKQIGQVFDLITSLVKNSGVEEVSGLGMSSLAVDKGLYRNKTILHHYPDQNGGYLWSMFGRTAHPLAGLDLLSANTALASFGDLDLPMLWKAIEREVNRAGISQAAEAFQQVPFMFEQGTGLKLDQFLGSLGNEYGFVLTLDPSRLITLPMPSEAVQIPEPGVMLVAKVKDDVIFNLVDQVLKSQENLKSQLVSVDKDGLKMRTLEIPLPLPLPFRPTLARSGDYLFLATSDTLIEEALAAQSGKKPGLKAQAEFKRLAEGTPKKGNWFGFMSGRFWETIAQIQIQAMKANREVPEAVVNSLKTFMNAAPPFDFSVSANTPDGWVSIGHGNQDLRMSILAPLAIIPAAVLPAIAIPNFVRARTTAQQNACIANLKQLDGAKEVWALENKKKSGDECQMSDLVPTYIKAEPKCPVGAGSYKLNPIGTNPQCPNHNANDPQLRNHKLPD